MKISAHVWACCAGFEWKMHPEKLYPLNFTIHKGMFASRCDICNEYHWRTEERSHWEFLVQILNEQKLNSARFVVVLRNPRKVTFDFVFLGLSSRLNCGRPSVVEGNSVRFGTWAGIPHAICPCHTVAVSTNKTLIQQVEVWSCAGNLEFLVLRVKWRIPMSCSRGGLDISREL